MEKIDKTKYISGKKASEILGVHQRTLYLWERKKKIETMRAPGGKRYYNVEKYLGNQGLTYNETSKNIIKCDDKEQQDEKEKKSKICYARVSSIGQKDDLERQKKMLTEKYPNHQLIEDIGSGINLTKRGLLKIINLSINGKLEELVIVHKDRLARFGYELLEYLIKKYSNGEIIIMNQKKEIEPEEEMVNDVLQIMNVFVAKMNGRRKYKNIEKKKDVCKKL